MINEVIVNCVRNVVDERDVTYEVSYVHDISAYEPNLAYDLAIYYTIDMAECQINQILLPICSKAIVMHFYVKDNDTPESRGKAIQTILNAINCISSNIEIMRSNIISTSVVESHFVAKILLVVKCDK